MNDIFIKNNTSEYVILVPEKTDTYIDFAVKTLIDTLYISTGVKLNITRNANKQFISIGNTKMLNNLGLKPSYGKDGFCVLERDKNLYLFGQSEYGPIWAVYEFLERTVGYKFFAIDEIKIEKCNQIDITGLDITYTPTFPHRCSGFGLARTDLNYATGLKAYANYGQKLDGEYFWGAWLHNQVRDVLPPKIYYKDHPDWYVQEQKYYSDDIDKMHPERMQLCFSNMQMRDEFFSRFIEMIKAKPNATHFVIGHEDNPAFCYCENCQKIIDKIGTSGLHMQFVNDIARRVENWRKENAPEREIVVCALAYELGTSFPPPVKEQDGEFVPIDESVVAEDNVCMLFAPMGMIDHSRSVTHPSNYKLLDVMNKWGKVCHKFAFYGYYGSFRRAFEFVDGLYSLKDDVEYYKNLGVEYYFIESPGRPGYISFQAMTLYVHTQLEWNKDLDTDELFNDFCDNYYKVASPFIKEYFHYMMSYYAKTRKRIEYLTGKKFAYGMCFTDTVPQGFWELNAVYDASLLLDQADKEIDESDYEQTLKEKLHDRVEIERMTLLHIQLEHFNKVSSEYDELRTINTYPKEKILELCDRFERDMKKFNFKSINGDGTPEEIINGWRKRAESTPRFWENRMDKLRKDFNDLK